LVALVGIVIIGSSFIFGGIITHKASLEVLEFKIDSNSIKYDEANEDISFDVVLELKNNGMSKLEIENIEFSNSILNLAKQNISMDETVLSRNEKGDVSISCKDIPIEDVQKELQKIEIKSIKYSAKFLLSKSTDVKSDLSNIDSLYDFEPRIFLKYDDTNSTVSKEEPLFTRSIILKNNSVYPVEINIEITYPDNVEIEDVNINGKTLEYTRSDNLIKINNELVDVNMKSILELECKPTKCGEGTFSIGIIDSYSLVEISKEEKILQSITSKSKVYFSNEDGEEVDRYYWPVDDIYVTVEDEDEKSEELVNVILTCRGVERALGLSRIDEGEFRNVKRIQITKEMVGDMLNVKYPDGNDQYDKNEKDIMIYNAIEVSDLVITSNEEPIELEKFEEKDAFSEEYSYTLDVNSTYELSFSILDKTEEIQNVEIVFQSENLEILFEEEDNSSVRISDTVSKLGNVKKGFRIINGVRHDNDIVCIEIRYKNDILIKINIKIIFKMR